MSLSRLGSMFMELEMERAVDAFVARGVSQAMLYEMDENHTGTIDRGEFLKYILLAMGKVEPEDVEKALRMFDQLDPQAQLEPDRRGDIKWQDVVFPLSCDWGV